MRNPLLDELLGLNPGGEKITFTQFSNFITTALGNTDNFQNFDPNNTDVILPDHKVTVIYIGSTNGVYNGNIANDLATRGGTDVRILDNTKMGRLLISLTDGSGLGDNAFRFVGDLNIFKNFANEQFKDASKTFVEEGQGKLVVIAGKETQNSIRFLLVLNLRLQWMVLTTPT